VTAGPRSLLAAHAACNRCIRHGVRFSIGSAVRSYVSEQERNQDSRARYEHGAYDGGQLQDLGEGLAGYVEQPALRGSGRCAATATAAPRVSRGLCGVGRNTVRDGFGHPVAVGRADAAEDRDGKRPTK